MYEQIYNSNLNENLHEDECAICYHGDIAGDELISLNMMNYVSRRCDCNVIVHKKCVLRWYITKKRCIICNSELTLMERTIAPRTNEIRNPPMDTCTRTLLTGFAVVSLVLMVLFICFADNVKGFTLLSNQTDDDSKYLVLIDYH